MPDFPPYGLMHKKLMDIAEHPPVPEGYVPPSGHTPEQGWRLVYDRLMDELAARIWPRWRSAGPTSAHWDGAAIKQMEALTRADFALFGVLRPELEKSVSQRATGQAVLASQQLHAQFFNEEDNDTKPLPILEYFPFADRDLLQQAASKSTLAPLPERVVHWMTKHCYGSVVPAKHELQRPRPYQMASILGIAFDYEFAQSAVTSAAPSGHAIQGVQGVCKAYLELAATKLLTPDIESRLRQYAVDHGDRRVFAGVHYASDNLASWCMSLFLCEALYREQAELGRQFLAQAVRDHSQVYRRMVEAADPAHLPILDWFEELAAPRP